MIADILMFLFADAAFLMLCAAMPRHQAQLIGRKLPARSSRLARAGGWAFLTLLFVIACLWHGAAQGVLLFAGYSTVGAALAVAFLCWRGR